MSLSRILACLIVPIMALVLTSNPAQAAGVPYNFGGDAITKVADLPDTEEFKLPDGGYLDLGWLHKEYSIVYAPFYVFEEKGYVYYSSEGNDTRYVDASPEMLAAAGKAVNTTFPEKWAMPFWKRWMGALILAGLILVLVLRRAF